MPQDSVVFEDIRQECDALIRQVCTKMFRGKEYNQTNVATWISQANEGIIKLLREHNGSFKYLVNTIVLQKKQNESGEDQPNVIDMAAECYWNQSTDGELTVQWEENAQMSVIVTLFACAL